MGTEYVLGKHGKAMTPNGPGVSLLAYEMSGELDVYIDLPTSLVEMDAWPDPDGDCARVNLWSGVDPAELLRIGHRIMCVAKQHLTPEETTTLLAQLEKSC